MFERAVRFPFCNLIIQAPDEQFLAFGVLRDNTYTGPTSGNFYLRINQQLPSSAAMRYRERMFRRGLYLGHHLGPPVDLYVGNDEIHIELTENSESLCNKLVWSFVTKYVLSVTSLRMSALHLKGVVLLRAERAVLLLGRGGAGKTTLSQFLARTGYEVISNTHCIVKNGHIWGVNTWVRRRGEDGSDHYELPATPNRQEGGLERIIVYEYNDRGEFRLHPLSRDAARAFVTYFAAGIGTYDLKEDMVDGLGGPFEDRYTPLVTEITLIDELVRNYTIDYLSCDLANAPATNRLARVFT